MPELVLSGCRPEPLLSYLKALGVFRLVSKQEDANARGCWRSDEFLLFSSLDREDLLEFFLSRYKPTPILGPWNGGSGFFRGDSQKAVEALAQSTSSRCAAIRKAILTVREELRKLNLDTKPDKEEKARLLRRLRAQLPDSALVWMDAALILQDDRQLTNPLLGSGGNDGRLDFSRNFMERLVDLKLHQDAPAEQERERLKSALFGEPVRGLEKASVGQFVPGRAGGPNSTQGLEGEALDNPWDWVLGLEGALLFTGAAVRRLAVDYYRRAAFPFTVEPLAVGYDSAADSDTANSRGELWLPIWPKPASLAELRLILSEGRAEVAGRPARNATDFARAAASLGVDRGISDFVRTCFLSRNGRAYLAIPTGRCPVRQRQPVDLLREVDAWLDQFRAACKNDNTPPRFLSVLRRLDRAIFDYCRYGGTTFFQNILIAIGAAERQLALSAGRIAQEAQCPPVPWLSADWIEQANDGSAEFALALAVAGLFDQEQKVPPVRAYFEAVAVSEGVHWDSDNSAAVWSSCSLSENLRRLLERLLIAAKRAGCDGLPLKSHHSVSLATMSSFLAGALDDDKIENLLWGLLLVRQGQRTMQTEQNEHLAIPCAWGLLKLLFVPEPLPVAQGALVSIKPQPQILSLLGGQRVGEACQLAMRRLRAAGLAPLPHPTSSGLIRDREWAELDHGMADGIRWAGALLVPLSTDAVAQLCRLALRPQPDPDSAPKVSQDGGGVFHAA